MIEIKLSDREQREFGELARSLGTHGITLATILLRAGFDPNNREYLEDLLKHHFRALQTANQIAKPNKP